MEYVTMPLMYMYALGMISGSMLTRNAERDRAVRLGAAKWEYDVEWDEVRFVYTTENGEIHADV